MDEHGPYLDAANLPGYLTVQAWCCVRFYPGTVHSAGWFDNAGPGVGVRCHANSAHIAKGVKPGPALNGWDPVGDPLGSVARITSSGTLKIHTDGLGVGGAIGTGMGCPDETLTDRGIWCGPSISSTSSFRFFQAGSGGGGSLDLNVQADYDRIAGSLSNAWFFWISPARRGIDLESFPVDTLTERVARLEALLGAELPEES